MGDAVDLRQTLHGCVGNRARFQPGNAVLFYHGEDRFPILLGLRPLRGEPVFFRVDLVGHNNSLASLWLTPFTWAIAPIQFST